MPTIIARHKVGDINTWLKGHQDRVGLFAKASSTFRTFQDTDDPNSVLLLIETDDPGALAATINDPSNTAIKAAHTVIDPITMATEITL
jgi:hypothetical protein